MVFIKNAFEKVLGKISASLRRPQFVVIVGDNIAILFRKNNIILRNISVMLIT